MTPVMILPLVTMAPKGGGWLSRDMGGLVGSKVVKVLENGLVLFTSLCCPHDAGFIFYEKIL
jgi:hypothetical protein